MSLARASIDRVTLPQSLLSLAKLHMRVTFPDDDQLIVQKIGNAIGLFERLTGYGVFHATWSWVPGPEDVVGGATGEACNRCMASFGGVYPAGLWALAPVMRVSDFTAVDDDDLDVKASYALVGDAGFETITPQYIAQVGERASDGLLLTLSTGFKTLDEVPPDLVEVLLQITADSYELREMHMTAGVDHTPYANSWMTGWWVPRC